MNWLLKAVMIASPKPATKFSIDFFKPEGGRKGFVSEQKILNNTEIIDLFEDAKRLKNLVVGRKKENYSMDFVNLTNLRNGFDSAKFEVECHATNSRVVKYLSLLMLDIQVNSLGIQSAGQHSLYCYKFTFYQANYYLK